MTRSHPLFSSGSHSRPSSLFFSSPDGHSRSLNQNRQQIRGSGSGPPDYLIQPPDSADEQPEWGPGEAGDRAGLGPHVGQGRFSLPPGTPPPGGAGVQTLGLRPVLDGAGRLSRGCSPPGPAAGAQALLSPLSHAEISQP